MNFLKLTQKFFSRNLMEGKKNFLQDIQKTESKKIHSNFPKELV